MSMPWSEFKRKHPFEAKQLEREYIGFESGPSKCRFDVLTYPPTAAQADELSIRAHDPSYADPWVWNSAAQEWES